MWASFVVLINLAIIVIAASGAGLPNARTHASDIAIANILACVLTRNEAVLHVLYCVVVTILQPSTWLWCAKIDFN
jgi:hypothetical protein